MSSFFIRQGGFRYILIISCVFVFQIALFSQEDKRLEILKTDVLELAQTDSARIRKLIGNVHLKQDQTYISCDSAYHLFEQNKIYAYGNVRINQGDSVLLTGDRIHYFGNRKKAVVFGDPVYLRKNEWTVTGSTIYYDMEKKIASFHERSLIEEKNIRLESNHGWIHTESKWASFRDSIQVEGPDYRLEADTLRIDLNNSTNYFYGPTVIYRDSSRIYTERGYYGPNKRESLFYKNVQIHEGSREIRADSIIYDNEAKKGRAYHHVSIRDTTDNAHIRCHKAYYDEAKDYFKATEEAIFSSLMDKDTLHIHADTLVYEKDSLQENPIFNAWRDVLIYQKGLQGVCDSLGYTGHNGRLKMFGAPLMWSDSTQFSADTIILLLENNSLKQVFLRHHSILLTQHDTLIYDQVSGKFITGWFKDGALDHMHVEGNGETIYFAKDDSSAYIGVNKALCSRMMIYLENNEVSRIKFLGKPEASMLPMKDIIPGELRLKGFNWDERFRPKSKKDLLLFPSRDKSLPDHEED